MKNLKKVLSLVLALAMALSLMTAAFAADASDYKDYSKVTYKEAVDVMTAAGIFNGGDGNNFNPDATLNREQAAKIITYMLVGQEKADKLTASIAPYADVAANRWSAGAIAYCTNEGILAGDGNGRFNPTAPVLGTQFAKMLLVALGYDAKVEKLVGNSWAINTSKLALDDDVDLDKGMEKLSLSDNLTREQAAQMAFNAMKATLVEYEDKGDNITLPGGIIINNGATKATPVTSKVKADATSISDDKTADGYYTVEFAEKYCKDLKVSTKSADQVDSFGRPATTWVYDGSTVGTYADDADDSIVLNKSITAQKAIVTDSDYMNYSEDDVASKIAVYVNGNKQSATSYKALADLELQAGDEIETFENDDNEIETIAVLRYSLAQIDEIETNLSSTYTKQGATCSITLQGLDETGIGSTYYDRYDNDSDKELAGYTPDYKEGTVLAVALKGGDGSVVLDSYVAESHSGKITKYNNGSKAKVTVDGTELPLHAFIATSTTSNQNASKIDFNLDDSTYAVYTDKNGYVIGIDESESVKIEDVYYVTGIAKDGGIYSDSYIAQAVSLADGSVTEFKLKDDSDHKTTQALYGNKNSLDTNYGKKTGIDATPAGLYTFDKDGGKYIAEKYDGDGSYYIVSNNNKATTISDKLNKDDNKMTLSGAKVTLDGKEKANTGKIYLNDKTNYVKVEANGDDIDVKFVTGGTSVAESGTTAIAIVTKSGSNYVASYVVLINQEFSNAGSEDVVYVPEKSTTTVSYTNSDGDKKTGYATKLYFLDGSGKTETVTVVGQKNPGFYTYEINDDEVYELDTKGVDALKLKAAYDDETGYVENTHVTGVYNNSMTIDNVDDNKVEDVDFADKVIIADDRGQDDRDKDLYTSEITSASQLKSAVEKKISKDSKDVANEVVADVYFDDGKVIMVYVKSMTDADGTQGSSKPEVGTNSLTLDNNGTITVTLKEAAKSDTKIDVTVKQLNGNFSMVEAITVKQGDSSATANISKVLEDGKTYTVTATVGGDSCTDTAVYRK